MLKTDYISLPGRIVEFDASKQTASIQICASFIYATSDKADELGVRTIVYEVPVHTPSGGGWSITMPIKAGDTCIIFFSQVGYDHWLFEDKDTAEEVLGGPAPHLRRSFCQEDGYALVGLNTLPRAVQSYTTDGSQWRNLDATQHIHLKEDLSIQIDSPTKLVINAPVVEVNATTTTVTSPSITLAGDVSITGTLGVTKAITAPTALVGDIEMTTHIHKIGTTPTTGPQVA